MDHNSELCTLKEKMMSVVNHAVANGFEGIQTDELGAAVDILKDLSEACYYEAVTKAMKEKGEEDIYGYHGTPSPRQEHYVESYLHDPEFPNNMRMGYTPSPNTAMRMSRSNYGHSYDNYRNARRHYTATHSTSDKEEMDLYANEHLMDAMAAIRDIYSSADPELKKRMKTDLSVLVNEMA